MPNIDQWHTKYELGNLPLITSIVPVTVDGLASGSAAVSSALTYGFKDDVAGEQATFSSYAVFLFQWTLAATGLAATPKINITFIRGIPHNVHPTLSLALSSPLLEDSTTLLRAPDISIATIPNDTALHRYITEPILLPPGPFAVRVENATGQAFVAGTANTVMRIWQVNRAALQRGWLES